MVGKDMAKSVYLKFMDGTEADVAIEARMLVANGQYLDAARAVALCRCSESVAAAVLPPPSQQPQPQQQQRPHQSPLRSPPPHVAKEPLHCALLAYGLGPRARSVICCETLARDAAHGDPDARMAMALLLCDARLLPEKPSLRFQEEMSWIHRAREKLLQRDALDADGVASPEDSSDVHPVAETIMAAEERARSPPCWSARASVVEVEGIKLTPRRPRRTLEAPATAGAPPLTTSLNAAFRTALQEVAIALAAGVPVLLEGPAGCGKTEVINYIAARTGNASEGSMHQPNGSLVRIHMDTSAAAEEEFNELIGSIYPEANGEFRWRPGPIGRAVEQGRWIVLEGLPGGAGGGSGGGSSSSSMVATLARLRPGGSLHVPGRGTELEAAGGYFLMATRTTGTGGDVPDWEPPGGWEVWHRVQIPTLDVQEMASVLTTRFEKAAECVQRVVAAVDRISSRLKASRLWPRRLTMREAVKVCRRLETTTKLTPEYALAETIDVMCAAEADAEVRKACIAAACDAWSLLPRQGEALDRTFRPSVQSAGAGEISVGRASLLRTSTGLGRGDPSRRRGLAQTGESLRLLERIGRCVQMSEPVLLSGESGTGKTASVQELARLCGKQLTVLNMSQLSDINDLMGGFRPLNVGRLLIAAASRFEQAFCRAFSRRKNLPMLQSLYRAVESRDVGRGVRLMREVLKSLPAGKRSQSKASTEMWKSVDRALQELEGFLAEDDEDEGAEEALQRRLLEEEEEEEREAPARKRRRRMRFNYSEGTLVTAMRTGSWILLDEINLAPVETLERLVGLLDENRLPAPDGSGGFVQAARGFAVFAAMNPPTDATKKALPSAIRVRFTEFHVGDSLAEEDLALFVQTRLFDHGGTKDASKRAAKRERELSLAVAHFFLQCRNLSASGEVEDASGKLPRFSLRSLAKMVDFARGVSQHLQSGSERLALYEGAVLAFATPLPHSSRAPVLDAAARCLLPDAGGRPPELKASPFQSLLGSKLSGSLVAGFLIERGPLAETQHPTETGGESFIVTDSVRSTLRDVARALTLGAPRQPVLLQGPTAAGKTSLVSHIARTTGHKLIRINNHEHTDVAEYLGGYTVNEDGVLAFQEGPLVQAARHGWWVLLDELNLAPSEVLEALNRLLDDNREVRVPETGEVVQADPMFALFATQNPPGLYAGRKQLSQAFRSRFVEVQVDDLPQAELETILAERGKVPASYARRMIAVMRELQSERRASGLFRGKEGFVTARDLFRWAGRLPTSREELAAAGFFLLAERVRHPGEREVVRRILERQIGVKLVDADLYREAWQLPSVQEAIARMGLAETDTMKRMVALLWECARHREPALLVGETGGGKTTACQLIAEVLGSSLEMVNLHMNSESSDFIGAYRPRRQRAKGEGKDEGLFEWADGPLVACMRKGSCVLLDELNMAEHAVVERLNSVLEPARTLLLSEKGGGVDVEVVVAEKGFQVFATMNPGGDFGKKELSAALQNRVTEIWVPPPGMTSSSPSRDFEPIVRARLPGDALEGPRAAIVSFTDWALPAGLHLSLRDVAAWSDFVFQAVAKNDIHPLIAFAHGAQLVFLDSSGSDGEGAIQARSKSGISTVPLFHVAWERVLDIIAEQDATLRVEAAAAGSVSSLAMRQTEQGLQFGPFCIASSGKGSGRSQFPYTLNAKATARNCSRVARALVLSRPILLEGSPGVGKTTLVEALAGMTRRELIRINLSEHTEMSDLVGCDVPTSTPGYFIFKEGPLVTAMQRGDWILLDEINLASQSVLEGLNAVLDHRRSVFIPEVGKEVVAAEGFRLFGAQNPASEGGGRRRLPRSFLNRFTRLHFESLGEDDIEFIATAVSPWVAPETVHNVVSLFRLVREQMGGAFVKFNLRDALRWCELLRDEGFYDSDTAFDIVVLQRLRSQADREKACELFRSAFGRDAFVEPEPAFRVSSGVLQVGPVHLQRGPFLTAQAFAVGRKPHPQILNGQLRHLQALAAAVYHGWAICLSGPPGSGKETIANALAAATGRNIHEVRLGPSADASDLLGGYEQTDAIKELRKVQTDLEALGDRALVELMLTQRAEDASVLERTRRECRMQDPGPSEQSSWIAEYAVVLRRLAACCEFADSHACHAAKQRIEKATSLFTSQGAIFEWVPGELLNAAQAGDWVVINGVNEVPLAVLDRLNPLLEQPGSETILAEAPPASDGKPQVFRPSPEFRLIMTMDPRRGEISKALRNRVIEISLSERFRCTEETLAASVLSSGLPGPLGAASNLMELLDQGAQGRGAHSSSASPFSSHLSRLGMMARLRVAHGMPWRRALFDAARLLAPDLPDCVLEEALSVRWAPSLTILDRSVEKVATHADTFAASLDCAAIQMLVDLNSSSHAPTSCEKVVRIFLVALESVASLVPATTSVGQNRERLASLTRKVLVGYCCALALTDDESSGCLDSKVRLKFFRELRAEMVSGGASGPKENYAVAETVLSVLERNMEFNDKNPEALFAKFALASMNYACSQSQVQEIRAGDRGSTALEIASLAEWTGTLEFSSAPPSNVVLIARLVELMVDVLEHPGDTTGQRERFAVICSQLQAHATVDLAATMPNLTILVHLRSVDLEETLVREAMPSPKHRKALHLEAQLVRAVHGCDRLGQTGVMLRLAVVEALCTLTSVAPMSPELEAELAELQDLVRKHYKSQTAKEEEIGPEQLQSTWSALLEGTSLRLSFDALTSPPERTQEIAKRAMQLGLVSLSTRTTDLVSLQRAMWGEASNDEMELDCLQRLWRAGMNKEADSRSLWESGPIAAILSDSPLGLLLKNEWDPRTRGRKTSASQRIRAQEQLRHLAESLVADWSHQWLGEESFRVSLLQLGRVTEVDSQACVDIQAWLKVASKAWIEAGHATLAEAVATHSLDPAMVAAHAEDIAVRANMDTALRTHAMRVMSAARAGHRERSLLELEQLQSDECGRFSALAECARRRWVYRDPELPTYKSCWERLRRITDTFASRAHVEHLVRDIVRAPREASAQEANWQASMESVSHPLALGGASGHLRDALGLGALGLERLRLGVRFALAASSIRAASARVPQDLIQSLLSLPAMRSAQENGSALQPHFEMHPGAVHAVMLGLAVDADDEDGEGRELLTTCFRLQVERWRVAEDSKLWDIQNAESLYTYGSSCREDETVEEANERDFRDTFGVESGEFLIDQNDTGSGMEQDGQTVENGGDGDPESHPKADPAELWDIFKRTLGGRSSDESVHKLQHRADATLASFGAARSLMPKGGATLLSALTKQQAPAAAFLVAMLYLRTCGSSFPLRDEGKEFYNFYTDPHPLELKEGVARLNAFVRASQRVCEKLFDGDSHPVLDRAVVVAKRTAASNASTSLSVLATAVELLLRRLDEWNRHFAPREGKLLEEQRSIAVLSARWRSMEVASWPLLLTVRERKAARRTSRWFPHMFEVVERAVRTAAAEPDLESAGKDDAGGDGLLAVLDQFLRSSSIGELASRVQLVTCFANFALRAQPSSAAVVVLANSLASLAGYYGQFIGPAEQFIAERRAPLEARMREFAKLARWDETSSLGSATVSDSATHDKNLEFFRLKAAAERNRRRLHGLCTDMDRILRTPLADVEMRLYGRLDLNELRRETTTSQIASFMPEHAGSTERFEEQLENADAPQVRMVDEKDRLRRIQDIRRKLLALSGRWIPFSWLRTGVQSSTSLKIAARERALALASQEPTKDLVPVKKRALGDLLRALSAAGLSSHASQVRIRRSLAWLRTRPTGVKALDLEYYGCVLRQKKLVEASGSSLHADVSRREAQLMVAYTEHLFSLLSEGRDSLVEVRAATGRIHRLALEASAWSPTSTLPPSTVRSVWMLGDGAKTTASEALLLVESIKATQQIQRLSAKRWPSEPLAEMNDGAVERACDELSIVAAKFADVARLVGTRGLKDLGALRLVGRDAESAVSETVTALEQLALELEETVTMTVGKPFQAAARRAADRAMVLIQANGKEQIPRDDAPGADRTDVSEEEFVASARLCMDTVLIASQNFYRKLCASRTDVADPKNGKAESNSMDAEDAEPNEDNVAIEHELRRAHESARSLMEILKVKDIESAVDSMIAMAARTPPQKVTEQMCALVRQIASLLVTYERSILRALLEDAARLHEEGCRLLRCLQCIFVTVCQKGFCRPAEEEEGAEEGEGKDVDGVGMADVGDGDTSRAKDVSDQIEDEEQLTGLERKDEDDAPAEPREEGGDEQDGPDESEGIEMNADFEGSMHKREEKEEDADGDQDDGDEEDEEMEKRFGDTKDDVEDNEVVDEKLWDEDDEDHEDPKDDKVERGEKGVEEGAEESEMGRKEGDEDPSRESRHDDDSREQKKQDGEGSEGEDGEENEEPTMETEVAAETDMHIQKDRAVDEEENNELPDHMSLDNDEKDEDENEDDNGAGEESNLDGKEGAQEDGSDAKGSPASVQDIDEEAPPEGAPGDKAVEDAEEERMDDDAAPVVGEEPAGPKKEQPEEASTAAEGRNMEIGTAEAGGEDDTGGFGRRDEEDDAADEEPKEKNATDAGVGQGGASDPHGEDATNIAKQDDQAQQPQPQERPRRHEGLDPRRIPANELADRWRKRREVLQRALQQPEDGEDGQDAEDDGSNGADRDEEKDDADVVEMDEHGDKAALVGATEEQQKEMEGVDITGKEEEVEKEEDDEVTEADDCRRERVTDEVRNPASVGAEPGAEEDAEHDTDDADMDVDAGVKEGAEEAASGATVGQEDAPEPGHTSVHAMDLDEDEQARQEEEEEEDGQESDLDALCEDVEEVVVKGDADLEEIDRQWRQLEEDAAPAAAMLCEQLRLLLEPTVATRLAGDYRTGKRLSMRRVIEFVASDYRRDRIWLRRTKPEKRAYDVLICIDDSESMTESGAGPMALKALALLSGALARLEVGRVAVASFGDRPQLLHSFTRGTAPGGGALLSSFTFQQEKTNVRAMLEFALQVLNNANDSNPTSSTEISQLVLVISDGRLGDREAIQRLVREAVTNMQVIAFFLVDNKSENMQSIRNVKKVHYDAKGQMRLVPYLDDFPFPFYVVLGDVSVLPETIADALRQWFELVNSKS